jgi:hypothetical protein
VSNFGESAGARLGSQIPHYCAHRVGFGHPAVTGCEDRGGPFQIWRRHYLPLKRLQCASVVENQQSGKQVRRRPASKLLTAKGTRHPRLAKPARWAPSWRGSARRHRSTSRLSPGQQSGWRGRGITPAPAQGPTPSRTCCAAVAEEGTPVEAGIPFEVERWGGGAIRRWGAGTGHGSS